MIRLFPSSLRARLLLLLLLAIVPPIVVMVRVADLQRRQEEGHARASALQVLRIAVLQHEHAIDGARQLAISLADLSELRRHDAAACTTLFEELLEEGPQYAALAATDTLGRVFAAAGEVRAGGGFAGEPWFQRALHAPDHVLGTSTLLPRAEELPSMVCAAPLLDRQGHLLGTVAVWVRLGWLGSVGEDLGRLPGGALSVFDGHGTLLARRPADEGLVPRVIPGVELVALARCTGRGVGVARGFDGRVRIQAFDTLTGDPDRPLWVAVGVSREAAFAPARRTFENSVALLLLLAGAFVALWWITLRLLVLRRVETLLAATRRLTHGDLTARIGGDYGRSELGELSRAFDVMTEAIQQRRAERDRAESALRESEAIKTAIADAAPDAVLTMDSRGAVREINGAAERLFGVAREQALGADAAELLLPADLVEGFRRELANYLATRESGLVGRSVDARAHRADGTEFPVQITITPVLPANGPPLFSAYVRDLTESRRYELALHELALVDDLTGLYNRRGFTTFAAQQLRVAQRTQMPMLLLIADLDNLKEINDRFGHSEGDHAIAEAGLVMRETFRRSDVLARVGGDEFAVLAMDTSDNGPIRTRQRLLARVELHNQVEGRRWPLAMSLGVARWDPAAPRTIEQLMGEGDALMYEHKRARRERRSI